MQNGNKRIFSALRAVLLLLFIIPMAVMAESADREKTLRLGCGFGVDENAMSADQRAIREAAVNQYYAAEDEVLAKLVAAGMAAQADVDAYQAGRNARWLLTLMDKSAWTVEQTQAYENAMALSGIALDAAADALVSSGQLTNKQGEALKATNTNTSRSITLTDTSAVNTASGALDTLRQELRQTLADASIKIRGGGSEKKDNQSIDSKKSGVFQM